jgi:glutamate 5-kinase
MSAAKSNKTSTSGLAYQRIVVKAGTNVLTTGAGALDAAVMATLVEQVVRVREMGAQVVLVTSGAMAAGRDALGQRASDKVVPELQQLAAIGQSRLMYQYQELFSHHDTLVAQALLTRRDVEDRQGYLNVRNTLEGLLDKGVVPVVNENDVVNVEELGQDGFGDNDQLSALVANLIDADLLILLTNTGGLYTADPHRDASATLIEQVDRVDDAVLALAGEHRDANSRGGMRSKLESASLATSCGVTVVIASGGEPDVVHKLVIGQKLGTLFPTTVSYMESRKRWLLSGLAPSGGVVIVDAGAVKALRESASSLLPAGVKEVRGHFNRGDVVIIASPDGERVACGVVNYDDADVRSVQGVRSNQILEKLGHQFGDEVVHRNNMVVL